MKYGAPNPAQLPQGLAMHIQEAGQKLPKTQAANLAAQSPLSRCC